MGLGRPFLVFVAHTPLLPRHFVAIGILGFVVFPRYQNGNESPLRIRAVGLLVVGIKIHSKRVSDAPDSDNLIERIFVFVLSKYAPIAPAVRNRSVKPGIVCNVSITLTLDLPDESFEHLGGVGVTLVSDRTYINSRSILPLVIGDLMGECRYLVD